MATDRNFDALPVDNMEPQTDPVAWRAENPQLAAAWLALWGFRGAAPLDKTETSRLHAAREAVQKAHGADYDTWVLQQAGIGTMLANRVTMGPLKKPQFQWVPYDDALLFPLNNTALAASTPDKKLFFPMEDKLRLDYLNAMNLQKVPSTLDMYLAEVLLPTLQRQKADGAIAIKFEIAYLRGFGFGDPSYDDAAKVYAKYAAKNTVPDDAEYKSLQDYLFRTLFNEAGSLGLAVHLHTMSGGGGYFGIAGANPALLEPLFNDPRLRKTNFVMLHGGWPYVREAGAMLQKPNVYLDLSQEALTFPPRTLALWLREWLETFPDKVLYGTDGYPFSDSMGWEESLWIANGNARAALGLALTGMLQDGEIDRAGAEKIATMVLRGNAIALYRLNVTPAAAADVVTPKSTPRHTVR